MIRRRALPAARPRESGERGATAGGAGGAGASDMGGGKSVRGDTVAPEEGSATGVTPEKLNRARRRAVARTLLKPNRAQRRAARRSQQRWARLAASLDARRQVLTGAAKDALAERLAAIPPLARRRRVAMWRRRWRRDRRRRASDRDGANHTARRADSGAIRPQQERPRTFWDKVWAVPIRIWNALMRAYYGNKLRASRLPADRSAVPAGSLARLLLTYMHDW